MEIDLYCKIFVNSNSTIGELAKLVCECFNLNHDEYFSIEGDLFTIEVNKNDEFNKEKSKEFPDGFLYFPYYLDIDSLDYGRDEEYIAEISKLLNCLWEKGFDVVTAGDFEQNLPYQGGYKKEWLHI